MTKSEFFEDTQTQDSVLRRLEIIGEASKKIPHSFRRQHPQISKNRTAGHSEKVKDVFWLWTIGADLSLIPALPLSPVILESDF
ncbi:hypothetical protein CO018_01240 [Candidatus Beckwithbacteria bacterium CG_4_9_14_0_2_um_filter_47_11]|uniref:Uncharacterized protein n=1 Tax=Candidatus Beckwithbacteria bacterium CG_4_9_14_0_2_um_filter_47_11 TaxID=1974494 RepID=A0A2M8G511_9BACT|nr:MAG: hypothetical protein CO018_01240 [Candidatus Beckwithbacteria bacterium CG_4_9_14_0_2_um_filter_47_11]